MRGIAGTPTGSRIRESLTWFHHQVHGGVRRPRAVWFQVHPGHVELWGEATAEPVTVDTDLLDRLAAGLQLADPTQLSVAVAPAPRPESTLERSYAGLASLLRQSSRCLLGVPADVADRMPWAAAGCGLLTGRLGSLPVGARVRPVGTAVTANALPGWMIGTDELGVPVLIHLSAGSTVLLTGATAEVVAATIATSGRVIDRDVSIVRSTEQWLDAWHPQCCRVVVAEGSIDDLLGDDSSVIADVTVDLDAQTVTVSGSAATSTSVPFTPLPLRW